MGRGGEWDKGGGTVRRHPGYLPLMTPRRALALVAGLAACACGESARPMSDADLHDFASRYTAAWCSQDPASVAAFFAEDGSLTINAGDPAVGREAITASARGFMTAFPDLVVAMDSVVRQGDRVHYHWTLTGTNTGPGGTGASVRISGWEAWRFGPDGLVVESLGHFDAAEYDRQLQAGPGSREAAPGT